VVHEPRPREFKHKSGRPFLLAIGFIARLEFSAFNPGWSGIDISGLEVLVTNQSPALPLFESPDANRPETSIGH